MSASEFCIQHFDGQGAHGPVTLFISDDGGLAFVCTQDNQQWELEVKAKPARKASQVRRLKVQSATDHLEEVGTAAATSAVRSRTLRAARQMLR